MRIHLSIALAVSINATLSGCGLTVPALDSRYTNEYSASTYVNSVASHIHCELRHAVQDTYAERPVPWLADWSAKVSLTLTVEEKANFSPGLSLTQLLRPDTFFSRNVVVLAPQSFNVGVGGTVAADATRVLQISWFLVFKDLLREVREEGPCSRTSPFSVEGDLKIKEGLFSGVLTANVMGTVSDPFQSGGPLDVIEHHVTFNVDLTGNVTPTWKLVNVSANSEGTFWSGTRTRKDDLLITMGPTQLSGSGRALKATPSRAVENAHLAAQIGQAVSTAVRR
jgi:hypothetical protein